MIATVTYNPAIDQTMRFDQPIDRDTVHRADSVQYDASGKGINVSRFLTGLETRTYVSGAVGGFTGSYIRSALMDAGIDHDFVDIDGQTRINTTAITRSGSYKFNQSGPQVDADIVDTIYEHLQARDPEWVHIGGSLPPGLSHTAIDALSAGPWRTSVDVGGEILQELDGSYDLCKPNRTELAAATGFDVSSTDGCLRAARRLQNGGFDQVLASLGSDGAILVTPEEVLIADALDIELVDEVGAGDALVAGVLAGFDSGLSVATSLRAGIASAGHIATREGSPIPDTGWLPPRHNAVSLHRP